jgi:hypothetical protein
VAAVGVSQQRIKPPEMPNALLKKNNVWTLY